MGVTRRFIFPILRIILWAVIAVALVKLAFAGQSITSGDDPLQPSAEIVEPQVPVTTGSITNTVSVQGSVIADPAVPAKATMAGTVTKLVVASGQHVDAGAGILEITLETPVEPTVTTNPETGEQTVKQNKPIVKKETVKAPSAGTLTLTALTSQIVSVGDVIGSVSPGSLSVTGTLTPDQQYRLLTAPADAQVTLKGGPAPFTCTGLRIGAPPADQSGGEVDPSTGQPIAASGSVTCAVPADVTAFAGLGADIAITNGAAEGVLVVPVTSVQGSIQKGNVWVVLPDGTQEQREVGLGLTDGEQVQITAGLAEGDEILQFIPIGDVVDPSTVDGGFVTSGIRRLMALLELTDVTRSVRLPDDRLLEILQGVTLSVDAGEHVAVVGRSGTGKSTLLNILGLLDSPTSGEYVLDGTPIGRLSSRARARRRGDDFGFVFQQFNLLPGRTALENVAAPLMYARGRAFWRRFTLAAQMLERVGLGGRLDTMPEKLSGGEQQRVAIARALVRRPRVILADEPTGALDVETGGEVMSLLDEIASDTGAALIAITHDLGVAARAQRHYRLADGVLVPIVLNAPGQVTEWLGDLPVSQSIPAGAPSSPLVAAPLPLSGAHAYPDGETAP